MNSYGRRIIMKKSSSNINLEYLKKMTQHLYQQAGLLSSILYKTDQFGTGISSFGPIGNADLEMLPIQLNKMKDIIGCIEQNLDGVEIFDIDKNYYSNDSKKEGIEGDDRKRNT